MPPERQVRWKGGLRRAAARSATAPASVCGTWVVEPNGRVHTVSGWSIRGCSSKIRVQYYSSEFASSSRNGYYANATAVVFR